AQRVTASLSVWPPSVHSLAAPGPRYYAPPRHPGARSHDSPPASPWLRPPDANNGFPHWPVAGADSGNSESASNENTRSHPAPPGNTASPRLPTQTAPSSPPAASARTSAAISGVEVPWAPRLKSPASAYPTKPPPPENPAPDSTARCAPSSAADIPTDWDVERRAWQRHSSTPPAVPRSGGAGRADPQSGQRSAPIRPETRQRLTSSMAASGQYTGWHSSGYPLKRSNSRPYFSSVPLLFRSQGITGFIRVNKSPVANTTVFLT